LLEGGRAVRERLAAGRAHGRAVGVRGEVGVGVESVLAGEEAGEEIEDAVEVDVNADFEIVLAAHVGEVVDELRAPDRRFARAEVVAAEQEEAVAGLNLRFGQIAVGRARFGVARELEAKLVDDGRRDGRGERAGESGGAREAVAGMFFGGERAGELVVDAREVLPVEAQESWLLELTRMSLLTRNTS
jgi:hypothetical protein